jgi:anti-anti-sigma factor
MKRDQTAANIRLVAHDERAAPGTVSDRVQGVDETDVSRPARAGKPRLVLADSNTWTHTLIPTGNLDRDSAPRLEAEIERLFENGITRLVVDLRQLTAVDSTGLAVLAFRCELCKRRGYDLRLVPGSRLMQRAFEEAGVADLLLPSDDRIEVSRVRDAESARPSAGVTGGDSAGSEQ